MAKRIGIIKTATGLTALALVAACSPEAAGPSASVDTVDCVQVDEGNYIFQNGKFIRANAPAPTVVERVVVEQAERQWYEIVEADFPDKGYSFMGLNVRRNIATLIGLAPDAETKAAAFEAGKAAILARPESAGFNVINACVLSESFYRYDEGTQCAVPHW